MNSPSEELACLYVLDQLDAGERAAFEARMAKDPELVRLTREYEAAFARRIRTLPPHEPPAGLLARIEAGIDRLPSSEERRPSRPATPLWATVARWGIAAVIAVGVSILAVQSLRHAPAPAAQPFVIVVGLDSARSTLAELPVPEHAQNADASFIQLASLAEKFWKTPGDLPVKTASTDPNARGYALFDPGSSQGFIAIRRLPDAEKGKRYHLWLVDTASGLVREAGILPVAGSAQGLYFFSVTPTTGAKSAHPDFFVTVEDNDAPEPAQPHGRVVLGDRRI